MEAARVDPSRGLLFVFSSYAESGSAFQFMQDFATVFVAPVCGSSAPWVDVLTATVCTAAAVSRQWNRQ